jgi:hypothetical protein
MEFACINAGRGKATREGSRNMLAPDNAVSRQFEPGME